MWLEWEHRPMTQHSEVRTDAALRSENRADLQTSSDQRRMITLKQGDARELARLLALLTDELNDVATGSSPARSSSLASGSSFPREALVKAARQRLSDRRRRTQHFSHAIFGEPAWEMLLILYIEHDRRRLITTSLTGAAGVAPSTALRWLAYLESQGLVSRREHPTDARASFVDITETAVRALDSYFSETLTAVQ
jgi:DNA-binding MarR family transcriptional regulator